VKRLYEPDDAIHRMAARGRAHVVATYSAETMAERYIELYDDCLARRRRRGERRSER
jgi:hypothetical protein